MTRSPDVAYHAAIQTPVGMTWESDYHAPVLVREVLQQLGTAHRVLDGTLGGGGHTAALLDAGVSVTAVDRDPQALAAASQRLRAHDAGGRLTLLNGNFSRLGEISALEGATFDGILLDLGVSSHQLDEEARGFTFRRGAPLDMRMGDDAEQTAAEFLNTAEAETLSATFRDWADEPKARGLAAEIVRRRGNAPFVTSDDLVGAIRAVRGPSAGPADFARIFQALRIAVNRELDGLAEALPDLRERLTPHGVLVVISYHSGEDRLVKQTFQQWSRACVCPPRQPFCTCAGVAPGTSVTRKPVRATAEEIDRNPRARSALLRAWRRAA